PGQARVSRNADDSRRRLPGAGGGDHLGGLVERRAGAADAARRRRLPARPSPAPRRGRAGPAPRAGARDDGGQYPRGDAAPRAAPPWRRALLPRGRAPAFAVVLGAVERRPAEHRARVADVAVAPAVVGDGVEHVEAQAPRRLDAGHEHARHVALAAPDRELPRGHRPILRADPTDAHAEDRQAVGVGIGAPECLAPDLAGAVEPAGAQGRLVGERRPRARLLVARVDDVAQWRIALPAGDRGAAAGEDHPSDAGAARGLEDVIRPGDVAAHDVRRRIVVADGGAEVHDGVDVLERGLDRVEVAEVGSVALDAGHRATIESAECVTLAEVLAQRAADEAGEP